MKLVGFILAATAAFYTIPINSVNAQIPEVKYTYEKVVIPSLSSFSLSDINDNGDLAGTGRLAFTSPLLPWNGILINGEPQPVIIHCDGPDSATHLNSIHATGSVAGQCISNYSGHFFERVYRGFIRRSWGEIIFISPPGAVEADVQGISNQGTVVGRYRLACADTDIRCIRSFVLLDDYQDVSVPVANAWTLAKAINSGNQIVGDYQIIDPATDDLTHAGGFILDNGHFTHVEYPATEPNIAHSTELIDINDNSVVLGVRWPSGKPFLYDGGAFFNISLPAVTPGFKLSSVQPSGLSDNGKITGFYWEISDDGLSSNVFDFVATPEPVNVVKVRKPRKK